MSCCVPGAARVAVPAKRDSHAEERFARPTVVPIHGAGTEVEFACKMDAFVYTIGAMMPVVPRPKGREGAAPDLRRPAREGGGAGRGGAALRAVATRGPRRVARRGGRPKLAGTSPAATGGAPDLISLPFLYWAAEGATVGRMLRPHEGLT